MATDRKVLNSWQDAQHRIVQILAALNANSALLMAAAANPLLALEELGYEVNPEVQQDFVDRIRFGSTVAKQQQALRRKIFDAAGHSFDLNSSEALVAALGRVLKNKADAPSIPADAQPPRFTFGTPAAPDPLEHLRGAHPIMEPLLEYRKTDATTPQFATRDDYTTIRLGKRVLPVTRLVANLQSKS